MSPRTFPKTASQQPRFAQTKVDDGTSLFWWYMDRQAQATDVPRWGSNGRAAKLRGLIQDEPILGGAVASLGMKVQALDWTITGGKGRVATFHPLLAEAQDGEGWDALLDAWLQDYLVVDLGGVIELARAGRLGPVAGLYHVDASRLTLTSSVTEPLHYWPAGSKNKAIPFAPTDFARIVDMRSPDEEKRGLGYSAVSRALKAAKLLTALYQYEEEQLSDLPPQGIVSITGMTMPEVISAMDLYEAKRAAKEQLTFKGVLWLAAQANSLQQVDVKLTPFSTLPAHWDRKEIVTQYIYILALVFGVDPREFWPVSGGSLGTGKEAEVQAQKAKGKGFGRILTLIERAINWHVLPAGLEFSFVQQDAEDALQQATVHARLIENARRLWEPNAGLGHGLIGTEEARRLLYEQQVLPEWLQVGAQDWIETSETPEQPGAEEAAPPGPEEEADAGEPAEDSASQLEQKAARAGLRPGEPLVAVHRDGSQERLWPPRRYVPGWEVPAGDPFADWASRLKVRASTPAATRSTASAGNGNDGSPARSSVTAALWPPRYPTG